MPIFRKTVIRPETYSANSPTGRKTLTATRERIKHWHDQFQAMDRAGIKIPVPWGHQPKANPAITATEQLELTRSKLNAGYLAGSEVRPDGALDLLFDVPGAHLDDKGNVITEATLADGRKVPTAIREVSLKINDFKDGKGRDWKDSILHAALVTHPVVTGQGGFALSVDDEGAMFFSVQLASDDGDKNDDDPPAKSEEKTTPKPSEVLKKPNQDAMVADFIADLARVGIVVQDDTNAENFWDRAPAAVKTFLAAKAEKDAEETSKDKADDPKGGEESMPMLMSINDLTTPLEKALFAQQEERERKDRKAKLADLLERGMPKHHHDRLSKKLTGYTLSLTTDGKLPEDAPLDVELSTWDEALPKSKMTDELMRQRAKEEALPIGAEDELLKEAKARGERLSRKAS